MERLTFEPYLEELTTPYFCVSLYLWSVSIPLSKAFTWLLFSGIMFLVTFGNLIVIFWQHVFEGWDSAKHIVLKYINYWLNKWLYQYHLLKIWNTWHILKKFDFWVKFKNSVWSFYSYISSILQCISVSHTWTSLKLGWNFQLVVFIILLEIFFLYR